MKPLLYGYVRMARDIADDELDRIEQQMKRFADIEGFCYATTFYEYQSGSFAAFAELTEELKRAEARDVIVPSLNHVARHALLRMMTLYRLEEEANAEIHTLEDNELRHR